MIFKSTNARDKGHTKLKKWKMQSMKPVLVGKNNAADNRKNATRATNSVQNVFDYAAG